MPDPDPPEEQVPPPAEPTPKKKKVEKKDDENPDSDDDDILQEILQEYQAKVPADVANTIKGLSVTKQIKILKGLTKKQKADPKAPKKKVKKEVKENIDPADVDEPAPPLHEEPIYTPLVDRFKNREEWLSDFMAKDKLYYKGIFNKNV